jgi:hypothetical protein
MKAVQPKPAGEASSPQKRAPNTSKQCISSLFLSLWVIIDHLNTDPDPDDQNQCG